MTEAEFVGKWRTRFADNDTFTIDEGDLRELAEDIAATFGSDDPRAVFQEILENQFGKHPAFTTSQHEVNAFLLQMATAQLVVAAPDAPTFSGFDDAANTVAIAHPDYSYADLRYDFNGQVGLLVPTDGVIKVGNVAGQVAGYVRAAGGRAQGNKAYSPAFTTTTVVVALKPTAPTFSNFDDATNTVNVHHPQYGFADLRYDFNGQTGLQVSSTGLLEVGDFVGQVAAYVVADASKNRAEGDKAYSRPFTKGGVVAPGGSAPTVTGFNPAAALVGASVSLSGTNFTDATGVLFNGTPASFAVLNATTITATVPAGATTGKVQVSTPSGTGISAVDFTVTTANTPVEPVNTTPVAPSVAFDAALRILTATHPLGTSEIEYQQNNGGFQPYAAISVDNANHNAGEWKYRTRAATGRNVSGTADSPPIAAKVINQVDQQSVVIHGQSNSAGLARQMDLTAAEKGPFSLTKIWNDIANAGQTLQIGVNECGLNGALTQAEPRSDGATGPIPGFYDGFGSERRLAERWQANNTTPVHLIKPNAENVVNNNGASMQGFLVAGGHLETFAAQADRQKQWMASQGLNRKTTHLIWVQGEAEYDPGRFPNAPGNVNPDFVSELNAVVARFRIIFDNSRLKVLIVGARGVDNRYAGVRVKQQEYVLQEPDATFWQDPAPTYLPDGIHLDKVSMDRLGSAAYDFIKGTLGGNGQTTTLFSDNFNRTDGAPGNQWQTAVGPLMQLVGSRMDVGSAAQERLSYNTSVRTANGTLSADLTLTGGASIGLVARMQDELNYLLADFGVTGVGGGGLGLNLYRIVNGNIQPIGQFSAGGAFPFGSVHNCKFSFSGSSLKCYFDNSEVLSITDATFTTSGYTGLRNGSGADGVGVVRVADNYLLTDVYDGGTGTPTTPTTGTFADSFNRANGDVANSWVAGIGSGFQIVNQKLDIGFMPVERMSYNTNLATLNGTVQADITLEAGCSIGLVFRMQDSTHHYLADYGCAGGNQAAVILYSVDGAGVFNPIGITYTGKTFVPGSTHTAKVVFDGSQIQCFLDGELIRTDNDSRYISAGYTGLRNGSGGEGIRTVDQFVATST